MRPILKAVRVLSRCLEQSRAATCVSQGKGRHPLWKIYEEIAQSRGRRKRCCSLVLPFSGRLCFGIRTPVKSPYVFFACPKTLDCQKGKQNHGQATGSELPTQAQNAGICVTTWSWRGQRKTRWENGTCAMMTMLGVSRLRPSLSPVAGCRSRNYTDLELRGYVHIPDSGIGGNLEYGTHQT